MQLKANGRNMLKEDDIRPDELMKGQAERFANDIRRLLKHKNEFITVPCPACGEERATKALEKYELNYMLCDRCSTMYVSPRPSPAHLQDYYEHSENYEYWNKYIFPASEAVRREKIFRPRAEHVADICRRYNVPSGCMLEVGAGFGTFCEEMKRIGTFERIVAVEPTPSLAKSCRQRGLNVIEKPIEEVRLEEDQVNVVVSFEVIEHLFNPREYLRSCASILQPGGLVILTCPNVRGFDVLVLQEHSNTVDVEHLNYFHPDSLSHLLKESGFNVLEVMTPGKLDAELVRKKVLSGEFGISDQPFLQRVLIDDWDELGSSFQQFLAANLLSSHMWIVGMRS